MGDVGQLVDGSIETHQCGHQLHNVGGMRATYVTTSNATIGPTDELQQAVGLMIGKRLAVGPIVYLATLEALARLLLGDTNARRFGMGEDGGWHHVETDGV